MRSKWKGGERAEGDARSADLARLRRGGSASNLGVRTNGRRRVAMSRSFREALGARRGLGAARARPVAGGLGVRRNQGREREKRE